MTPEQIIRINLHRMGGAIDAIDPNLDSSYRQGQMRQILNQIQQQMNALFPKDQRDVVAKLESVGVEYGGRGSGGEYYSKGKGLDSMSLWTEGEERWTVEELEAIAAHKRLTRDGPQS